MQPKLFDRPCLREILLPYLQNHCGRTTLWQLLAIALLAGAGLSFAQNAHRAGFGVAWRVKGGWRVEGEEKQITTGAAIRPGALLEAIQGKPEHSITLLLPDGQRILYECFTMQDCDRGFRVPSLYREPDPISVDFLARVNAVISRGQGGTSSADLADLDVSDEASTPRDEAAAVLGSDHRVEIGGLAAALSDGSYWYEVRPLSSPARGQARRAFSKTGHSITLELPSEGLFDVSIKDQANRPRIDLLLLAVRSQQDLKLVKSFEEVRALLKDWNEDYQGWPVHDFQRDYLRSIALHIEPVAPLSRSARGHSLKADTTAEPRFSPRAGVFQHDIEVTLQCETPGATLYYTVDGSQPLHQSSVYRAPIVVKGTALTIKAFASAEGKKDSPVVTGIFRIGDS